ncbi:hypothetical protein [Xenorhabdus miraniensis]|uniref:Uncharacterized protein n=1 Tax=Xenorhabdus miraniensis TaxID=351674 RepID=A0A2D0JJY3_9GAMM|nr:hypothetical protein [Xenorhabdus miraniensis]PHM46561.1 hypothetical protein Xmir_04126 [Xenorhabdus miraniensis]
MELHLKMWIEGIFESGFDEVTAFDFVDDGEKSTLICEDKESLLFSLDKCQEIINEIRASINE